MFFFLQKKLYKKKIGGGGFRVTKFPSSRVSELPSFRVSKLPSYRVSESPSFQVSKFPSFKRREGGRTNERPGTDHVTSGPMSGLGKNCTRWRKHTYTHTQMDMAILWLNRPSGGIKWNCWIQVQQCPKDACWISIADGLFMDYNNNPRPQNYLEHNPPKTSFSFDSGWIVFVI